MFPWARLSVYQLDPDARQRLEKAAKLQKQSSGAFLERAGEERARKVLLEWTVSRYRQEVQSLSELASETGLVVEEIVDALGDSGREEAVEMFLASLMSLK